MLFAYFFASFFLSLLLTPLIATIMRRLGVVDRPTQKRKIHKKNIPLGGGLAIFIAFFSVLFWALFQGKDIGFDITSERIFGIFLGSLVLFLGGFLDDKYNFSPWKQICFPILASLIALSFGIGLESIGNPSGGILHLDVLKISFIGFGNFLVLADTLVFFWLMGMMFTSKLLDGMDGLSTGIVSIGALVVFFLSRQPQWFQPEVSLFAVIFMASCLGFLIWNSHPAKIFLGEGGSLFIGFILGVLAIISGSKIATTLLVMGLPMLDVARVIFLRLQRKKSIFVGDSEHLHFRLLNSGMDQRQTVWVLYTIAFAFGISTLFLQSNQKLIALLFLFILMMLLAVYFSRKTT